MKELYVLRSLAANTLTDLLELTTSAGVQTCEWTFQVIVGLSDKHLQTAAHCPTLLVQPAMALDLSSHSIRAFAAHPDLLDELLRTKASRQGVQVAGLELAMRLALGYVDRRRPEIPAGTYVFSGVTAGRSMEPGILTLGLRDVDGAREANLGMTEIDRFGLNESGIEVDTANHQWVFAK